MVRFHGIKSAELDPPELIVQIQWLTLDQLVFIKFAMINRSFSQSRGVLFELKESGWKSILEDFEKATINHIPNLVSYAVRV